MSIRLFKEKQCVTKQIRHAHMKSEGLQRYWINSCNKINVNGFLLGLFFIITVSFSNLKLFPNCEQMTELRKCVEI